MTDASQPLFSCQLPVRWGDMDAFGHVNNASYLRYMEEARFQWMNENGVPIVGDNHPVVVTIGCTFNRPIFYPETLRLDITIAEPGNSSFMAYYKIYTSANPTQPTAEGYSKIVWISKSTGKSVPMPDIVRSWF